MGNPRNFVLPRPVPDQARALSAEDSSLLARVDATLESYQRTLGADSLIALLTDVRRRLTDC